MNDYSDIIQGCIKRNRQAQLAFYELFCSDVYSSCVRILGDAGEAEEVMQETFLKILDRPDRYKTDREGMCRILKRMAVNGAIDLYRKRKVRFTELENNRYYASTGEPDPPETESVSPQTVFDAVDRLPSGYRTMSICIWSKKWDTKKSPGNWELPHRRFVRNTSEPEEK